MRADLLTNQYIIALVVPVILILSGAFAKKLVRGTTWTRSDFFLGVELSLSSIAATLTNFLDLSNTATRNGTQVVPLEMARNGAFLGICFFLLLVVLATHQEWEAKAKSRTAQFWWLGVFANLIGATLLVTFLLLVKGV
jgi:hypothetical protein